MRYQDVTAHQLIAEVAVNMAEEIYEQVCSGSNAVYKVQANRKDFIQQCAPTLKAAAKTVLGQMLADPNTSEMQKELIHEALVLDKMLPKGGTSVTKKHH